MVVAKFSEPSLTRLIIESYEGDICDGKYEGHGRAVFEGGHVYEGSFLEGVMHGKGRYEWHDGVFYEGDFTDNHIEGHGRYVWIDGSTYVGDVKRGLRHGFGEFVQAPVNKIAFSGRVCYQGQWKNGKRHGEGFLYYEKVGKVPYFEGEWVNDEKEGRGVMYYASGNVYDGQWKGNVKHGQGVMRWLNTKEEYSGEWLNGMQEGKGEHIWYHSTRSDEHSLFPLRNRYVGAWRNGQRDGQGSFFYATGASYRGEWSQGKKNGQGVFVFEDGNVYTGGFKDDRILNEDEAPRRRIGGLGPALSIDVSDLLTKLYTDITDPEERELLFEKEKCQLNHSILRHISDLKRIYRFYSALGSVSLDNTFVMNKMQFWRFCLDCKLHQYKKEFTLAEIDRSIAISFSDCDLVVEKFLNPHNPAEIILLRDFVMSLVRVAVRIFMCEVEEEVSNSFLSKCFSKLISEAVLPNACTVGGYVFQKGSRPGAVESCVRMGIEIYRSAAQPHQNRLAGAEGDETNTVRQFLFMLRDYSMLDNFLTPRAVISVFGVENWFVVDADTCNLEIEIVFLEFLEAFVGCAIIKYNKESSVKEIGDSSVITDNAGDEAIEICVVENLVVDQDVKPVNTDGGDPSVFSETQNDVQLSDEIDVAPKETETVAAVIMDPADTITEGYEHTVSLLTTVAPESNSIEVPIDLTSTDTKDAPVPIINEASSSLHAVVTETGATDVGDVTQGTALIWEEYATRFIDDLRHKSSMFSKKIELPHRYSSLNL